MRVAATVLAVVLTVIALAGRGNDTDPVDSVPGSGSSAGGGTSGSAGSALPPPAASTEPGPDDPMTRFTSVRADASGRTLTVTFWGGVDTCYRYAVRSDETARDVSLSLAEERRGDGPCIEIAQQYERTVRLEAPLGDRQVVDAATGEVVLDATRG